MRFSTEGFFSKSLSHGPLSIPWGPFIIFTKMRGDIRKITGVNGNGEKLKIFSGKRVFHIFLISCWVAVYTHILIF
jgi:hypothetical protein